MTTSLDSVSSARSAVVTHHAALRHRLHELTEQFISAIDTGVPTTATRQELVTFLRTELLPHAELEDALLYTGVRTDRTALLVRAMQDEHRMITDLVDRVERADAGLEAAIAAGALVVLCDVRIEQENNHLLPTLETAGLDLNSLLGSHPELVGDTDAGAV